MDPDDAAFALAALGAARDLDLVGRVGLQAHERQHGNGVSMPTLHWSVPASRVRATQVASTSRFASITRRRCASGSRTVPLRARRVVGAGHDVYALPDPDPAVAGGVSMGTKRFALIRA